MEKTNAFGNYCFTIWDGEEYWKGFAVDVMCFTHACTHRHSC